MRELNRRETLYGKKVKKKGSDDEEDDDKKQDDKDDTEQKKDTTVKRDQYALSMPKFHNPLKPEELEAEKKIREGRQPFYAGMVEYSEMIQETNKKVAYLANKMIDQTEQYKENKKNLPKDAEGIFILLEGSITVKNDYNEKDQNGLNPKQFPGLDFYPPQKQETGSKGAKKGVKQDRPELYDVLGAERFLQVQGYSYYGSIYSTCENNKGTTCGFMKQESLYLLPFYDLYQFKHDLEERYKTKCQQLQKKAKDEYSYMLKKM